MVDFVGELYQGLRWDMGRRPSTNERISASVPQKASFVNGIHYFASSIMVVWAV